MNKKTDYGINAGDAVPLPSNTRLEACVLGLVLDLPQLLQENYRYLDFPGLFYDSCNAGVWQEIAKRFKEGSPISDQAISADLKAKRQTELAIHVLMLHCFAENPQFIAQQCLRLNEYAIQRNILRLSYDLNITCQQPNIDALEALGKASEGLNAIYQHMAKLKTKSIADGVSEVKDQIDVLLKNPGSLLGLSSSLFDINMMIRGYRKGNMIVLAASTGEGKTTLAIQEALYLLEKDIPVGYFSLEMPAGDILLKFACTQTNISIEKVLAGNLNTIEAARLNKSLDWLNKSKLLLNDKAALKIGEIKAQSRMWKENDRCQFIIIDHMHLVYSDFQTTSTEQRFTDVANQIKEIAKELDIPVMPLAQLARKEKGEKRMHVNSDLKYAGGIEQAADVIIFIYRPALYGVEAPEGQDISTLAHIYTGKTRLLPGGKFNCEFDGLRFKPTSTGVTITKNIIPVSEIEKRITSSRQSEFESVDFSEGIEQAEMF